MNTLLIIFILAALSLLLLFSISLAVASYYGWKYACHLKSNGINVPSYTWWQVVKEMLPYYSTKE